MTDGKLHTPETKKPTPAEVEINTSEQPGGSGGRPDLSGATPIKPVEVTPKTEQTNRENGQIKGINFSTDLNTLRNSGKPYEEVKSKLSSHIATFSSFSELKNYLGTGNGFTITIDVLEKMIAEGSSQQDIDKILNQRLIGSTDSFGVKTKIRELAKSINSEPVAPEAKNAPAPEATEQTNRENGQIKGINFSMDLNTLRNSGKPDEEVKSIISSHIATFSSFSELKNYFGPGNGPSETIDVLVKMIAEESSQQDIDKILNQRLIGPTDPYGIKTKIRELAKSINSESVATEAATEVAPEAKNAPAPETKPAETAPETKPAETAPETKPAETAPETKPAETAPEANNAPAPEAKPADTAPVEKQPESVAGPAVESVPATEPAAVIPEFQLDPRLTKYAELSRLTEQEFRDLMKPFENVFQQAMETARSNAVSQTRIRDLDLRNLRRTLSETQTLSELDRRQMMLLDKIDQLIIYEDSGKFRGYLEDAILEDTNSEGYLYEILDIIKRRARGKNFNVEDFLTYRGKGHFHDQTIDEARRIIKNTYTFLGLVKSDYNECLFAEMYRRGRLGFRVAGNDSSNSFEVLEGIYEKSFNNMLELERRESERQRQVVKTTPVQENTVPMEEKAELDDKEFVSEFLKLIRYTKEQRDLMKNLVLPSILSDINKELNNPDSLKKNSDGTLSAETCKEIADKAIPLERLSILLFLTDSDKTKGLTEYQKEVLYYNKLNTAERINKLKTQITSQSKR